MWTLGITAGCAVGWYCPDNPALRSQMAVFVVRSLFSGDDFKCNIPYDGYSPGSCTSVVSKCDCSATIPYFTDVPQNHIHFKWIQKIRQLGISLGTSASTYTPDGGTSKIAAAILTNRAKQIQPCHPESHPTPGCFGSVNDNFTDYSTQGYFPLDLPDTPDPNAAFYRRVGQKMRDTGTIALGPQERAFGVWDNLSRGEASYYITRGLRKEFVVNRKVSQNNPGTVVWEPSVTRGWNTWLATWFQIDSGGRFTSYGATWNAANQTWNPPFLMNLPSGQTRGDDYITWDRYRGRFLSVFLSTTGGVRLGYSDATTYQSWTYYDVFSPDPGNEISWDFPSVAVDGQGRVIVGATKFQYLSVPQGFHVKVAADGFNFPANPALVPAPADGRQSRVVATQNMFHAFVPTAIGWQPLRIHYLYSSDGSSWLLSAPDPFVELSFPRAFTQSNDQACEPGSTTVGCLPVFFAPFIDATGDSASNRWSFVVPSSQGTRNNILICTSDRYCGFANPDSSRDQFLASSAIGPDGTYWVTYHSFSPTVPKPASNLTTHIVRIPPGLGPLTSYTTTHGTAPASWRVHNRCDQLPCYAYGDYNHMAVDPTGISATPLIQQTPSLGNDLYAVFSQDPSATGVFYQPYSAGARPLDIRKVLFDRLAATIAAPSAQFYDPLPIPGPVSLAPDPKSSREFVKFPAGSNLRSYGYPAPQPLRDDYLDYVREKVPDFVRSVNNGK